jgi:hypothetical protein
MSIEYYAVYDITTGAVQWKTRGPLGSAAIERVEPGMAVIEMPYAAFVAIPDDLSPLKSAVISLVNVAAGDFRKRYITDIPGQQDTYIAKEAEARAWTSGADTSQFPYLACEAAATNMTVDAVAALVLATAEAWRALDPKIEGRRRGATVAIDAATNIAEIVQAANVDWTALVAPPAPEPTPEPASDPETGADGQTLNMVDETSGSSAAS